MIPKNFSISFKHHHPRSLINYLQREIKLGHFLGLEKSIIKAFFREANQITKDMSLYTRNSKFGTMLSVLRGPIVYVCVRALKPEVMIETGVASGSSTRYILSAMEKNQKGFLYSIDLPTIDSVDSIPARTKTGWLVPNKLRDRWRLIFGRSQEKMPSLCSELGRIDCFLHDGEHSYQAMTSEYETAYRYFEKGGLLLSDDLYLNEAFYDFCREKNPTRWISFGGFGGIMK